MKGTFNGVQIEIVSVNGGWTTIRLPDGDEQKVRNKSVKPLLSDLVNQVSETRQALDRAKAHNKTKVAKKPAKRKPKEETSEEEGPRRVKLTPDHTRYKRGLGQTASGNDTYDIDDSTAKDLRGSTVDDLLDALAEKVVLVARVVPKARCLQRLHRGLQKFDPGIEFGSVKKLRTALGGHYEGLNPGMVRMNVGNRLRALESEWRGAATDGKTKGVDTNDNE
jgi:hypothetical protein